MSDERLYRRRIRGFDWVVIVSTIAIFFASLLFYLYSKKGTEKFLEVECVFLISAVEREQWEVYGEEWIVKGELLRSENGTVVMGKIVDVKQVPYMRSTVRNDEPIWEPHPYLVDLEVTVQMRLRGRVGDGLRAGDLRIAAGGHGNFRFGKLYAATEILELREVADE